MTDFYILTTLAMTMNSEELVDDLSNEKHLSWYKSLRLNQKINMRSLAKEITGFDFNSLIRIFGFRQSIGLIHQKLIIEGFNV